MKNPATTLDKTPVPQAADSSSAPVSDLMRLHGAVTAVAKPPNVVRRVLLSEDSSVNRSVAVQILRNLGYQVTAVSNGSEALAAAQRSSFDLIILDCETPEMDGYEAARAIRALPGGAGGHVPIIGLTAGSKNANREKRQKAGMSDYIVKPVRSQTVASVLSRWDVNAQSDAAPPLAVDRQVLTSLTELAGDSHATLLDELIELFLGSTPARIAELRQALKKKDAKGLGEAAHNLRGSSGQLGAIGIEQACASIETLARVGSLKGVRDLLDQLDLDLERVRKDLKTFAQEQRARPPKTEPPAEFDSTMLRGALQGKRLLVVHHDPQVIADLELTFRGAGCTIQKIPSEDGPFDGDLLFWGAALDGLIRLRDRNSELPVIVLSRNPDTAMLDHVQRLDADFVLEPVHSQHLQLRTFLRLTTSSTARTKAPAPAPSGPPEVLVAEDDALIGRFLVSNLEGAGFKITQVNDGDAALEAAGKKRYAAIILDINMPKTDGFGVLSQLRLNPELQRTPVLMLSARAQEHDIVKAFELGADDYVTKPFNPLELVTRVRRLTRRR